MPEGGFDDNAARKNIIIASEGDELLGYLMFREVNRYSRVTIVHLAVDEAYRGKGISTQLLDTLRVSTVTERDHVRDRSQLRVKSEKLKVETDTVYVERDSLRLTAYSLPGTEIDKDGNVTKKVNRVAQSLKWLFLTLVAIIAIIILMRIKLRR